MAALAVEVAAGATVDDWRAQFGEQLPDFDVLDGEFAAGGASGITALNAAAAPEPGSLALVPLVAIAGCAIRRRR